MANLQIDAGGGASKRRRIRLSIFLMAALSGPSALFGQMPGTAADQQQVVDVRIEGNRTIKLEKILPKIRTRAGRSYDLELIEEDVRRLNRTGMFINVKPYSQEVPGGRVVIFQVFERPLLHEVKYVGNRHIKTKVLEKENELKIGDALDPFAIEEGRGKIEEFYRSRGFSRVRVTVIEGNKPNDRRAVYLINEGRKQKVLWTRFIGNTIASDSRLRTQIESKPPFLYLFKGEIDRKKVDEDVNKLIAYYRGLGFFRARVGRELDYSPSENWLILTFVIDEGPRYQVRNVSFNGNTKFSTAKLAENLKLKAGRSFNQAEMNSDLAEIQDKYGGVGYIFADIKADPRFLEEPGTLDLVYNISEGDRYRVGKINVEIKGEYPHTRITTVLNRLSLKPGDIVDIRELRASERRLRASGLFLIDPSQGVAPKIVFSPPQLEEEESETARRPHGAPNVRGPSVRGQSPDPGGFGQRSTPDGSPARYYPPAEPRVDLTLCGHAAPADRRPVQPVQHVAPIPRQAPPPVQLPPVQPQPVQSPPTVVRGQFTTGRSFPSLIPKLPWGKRQPAEPSATGYAYEGGASPGVAAGPSGQPAPLYQTTPGMPNQQPAPVYQTLPGNQPLPNYQPAPTAPPYAAPQGVHPQMPPPPLTPIPSLPTEPGGIFNEDSPFFGGPPDGDQPTRSLPIDVIAQETQTGRFMFGVGVNSDAGLIGSIVIDEQNFDLFRPPRSWEDIRNATAFRGAGQRFRLEAVPGTQVQRYMMNFSEPYLLDSNVSLGLSGYYYDRRYYEWDEQRLGGRVSLGYQFTHDLSGSFSFRGAKININDAIDPTIPELAEVLGDNSLYGFRLQMSHDTRDSAFLATEGHLIEVAFEQVIGSFEYPRAEIDLRRYFLLHERPDGSGRHVLSLSARLGITGGNTPIYDHYYAGGFSTLRGFDFRGASPRTDVSEIVIGGEFQLLLKAQYLFPITADDMLRAVVFCDTGTVEPTINNWSDKYRVAPGVGLRITVPAMGPAPIALDFAFPIVTDPGDREEVFSFFVGFNY